MVSSPDSFSMLSRALLLLPLLLLLFALARAAPDEINSRPWLLHHLRDAGSAELRKRALLEKRQGFLDNVVKNVNNLVLGLGQGRPNDREKAASGGAAKPDSGNPKPGKNPLSDLVAGGGQIGNIVNKVTDNIVGSVTNLSGPAVADAGFLGGVGAGVGAAQGLGLLSVKGSKAAGEKVAKDNGIERTAIGNAVQESTTGFVATTLRAFQESNPNVDMKALASALGSGIGSGTAAGLRLTKDDNDNGDQGPPSNLPGMEAIAGNFAFGLSRSLADNADSQLVSNKVREMLPDLKPNVGRIANGFARGLLTGVGDGVEAIGGISSVLGGNTTRPKGTIGDTTVDFDDSVGGLAKGFGQGLGNSGTVTLQRVVLSPGAGALARRAVTADDVGKPVLGLATRIMTADSVSTAVQKAIELLNGSGVAGISLVLAGLSSSGAVSVGGLDRNTTDVIRALIPPGDIHFTHISNTYDVDGKQLARVLDGSLDDAKSAIRINGHDFAEFVALVTAHIVLALVALALLFPLALTLRTMRNLMLRAEAAHLVPRWTHRTVCLIWILGILPLVPGIFALGVVAKGTGGNFQTAHGSLSIVNSIIVFVAGALFFLTNRGPRIEKASRIVNQPLLISTLTTFISGLVDLGNVSLGQMQVVPFALAVPIGFVLGAMLVVAQVVFAFDALLRRLKPVLTRPGKKELDSEMLPPPLAIHKESVVSWRESLLTAVLGSDGKSLPMRRGA